MSAAALACGAETAHRRAQGPRDGIQAAHAPRWPTPSTTPKAREQLHNEQPPTSGGGHPVFNGQYPQWQREADALITKGQALLDTTSDPAQLAETSYWLDIIQAESPPNYPNTRAHRPIDKDRRY